MLCLPFDVTTLFVKGTGGVQGQKIDIFGKNICCSPGYVESGTFYGIKKKKSSAEYYFVKVGAFSRYFAKYIGGNRGKNYKILHGLHSVGPLGAPKPPKS